MTDNIIKIDTGQTYREDMARYSIYILYNRYVPDIRDGLKPVHRRILIAMFYDVKCISIFLSGSKKVREENIAKKHNISVRKAHNTVLQTDERRSKYHGYYTGEEWGMAGNYDLCINVDNLDVNELVEVIDSYINRTTDEK